MKYMREIEKVDYVLPPDGSVKRPRVHGHRGSRGTHPENTLKGFEEAVHAGCEYIELDVYLTKDDVPVIFHDWNLTRRLVKDTEGKPVRKSIPVRKLTLDELRRYDCGNVFQVAFPKQERNPSFIPTLEEFLGWLKAFDRKVGLNLELKLPIDSSHLNPEPAIKAARVFELLAKHDFIKRTIFQSQDFRVIRELKALDTGLRLGYQINEDKNFPETVAELGLRYAIIDQRLADFENIKLAHEKGIQVIAFTVNREKNWTRLCDLGIDGIVTDYPRKLIQFLDERALLRRGR